MVMNKKEWILIIMMLIFCIAVANAQVDIKDRCIDVVRGARVDIIESPDAYNTSTYLARIFYTEGNQAVMDAVDAMDDSWYEGLDMYCCSEEECLLDTIAADDTAFFRKAKSASVYVTYDGKHYFVAIFSW